MISNPESTPSSPPAQKSVRLLRPSVVVLCGPAACGKSTFAARHFRPTQIISSDHARALVCDDERDQRFSREAFALVDFIIEQRLSLNRLCVVDSTALAPGARRSLLGLAHKHRVPCVVFLFDIPLETCIARDQGRERSVGQPVIERQYRLFEQEKGNVEREGFDQVIKLLDEDLATIRVDILFRPVPRELGFPERVERGRAGHQPRQPAARREHEQRPHRPSMTPAAPQSSPPVGSAPPGPEANPAPASPSAQPAPERSQPQPAASQASEAPHPEDPAPSDR